MKKDKKFLRQCCNCKEIKEKKELIRITKDSKSKEIQINSDNKIIGRSIYICKNKECIDETIKKKRIEKQLKGEISENIRKKLYTVLTK